MLVDDVLKIIYSPLNEWEGKMRKFIILYTVMQIYN